MSFLLPLASLLLLFSVKGDSSTTAEPSSAPSPAPATLRGLCYSENHKLLQNKPIQVEDGALLEATDLGFSHKKLNKTTSTLQIFCVWFDSNYNAKSVIQQDFFLIDRDDIWSLYDSAIQSANDPVASTIVCADTTFLVSTSKKVQTDHLCSDDCETLKCDEIFSKTLISAQAATSEHSSNSSSPTTLEIIGLGALGLCSLLFIVAFSAYSISICRKRLNPKDPKQTKTEAVIGEVLDEIAKYTIGDDDDDMLFKEDWLYDPSSGSDDGQILGDKILHAVKSTAKLPGLPKTPPGSKITVKKSKSNLDVGATSVLIKASSELEAVIDTNSHNTSNDEDEHSIDESTSDAELNLQAATLVQRKINLGDNKNKRRSSSLSSAEELGQSIINHDETMSVEEKQMEK